MDTGGAAIATVLGNVCGAVYYLWYFLRKSNLLSISPKYFKPFNHDSLDVLSIGFPSCINSALMSVATILLNNALVSYGNNPVAAMGVATKAYMLIVFIQMGISNGIQPLLGYNFGAGNRKRFMDIAKFSAVCTFAVGSILTVIYFVFSHQIISVFIDDADVIKNGVPMLEAVALAGPVIGWMFILINSMQSMKKPVPAAFLSVCRQGLLFIPLLFLLKKFFGLNGIIYTQTIADYFCIIVSVIIFAFILRDKNLFVPRKSDSNDNNMLS
jgi:Na+-driven multidrug efflux pump